MYINQKNVTDAKLHLVFLFASPLVLRNKEQTADIARNEFKTKPLLQFKKELFEIKQSIGINKRVVRIKSL